MKEQHLPTDIGCLKEEPLRIAQLALALSQAQAEITGALKESANQFLESKYADLASCWDACRGPLSRNKLAVIQTTEPSEKGIIIVTTLAHESGEYIQGRLRMNPVKNDPQGVGSAITYGRRYGLCAIVGLAQVDDDGNAATNRKPEPSKSADYFIDFFVKAKSADDLPAIWKKHATEIRKMTQQEQDKAASYCKQLKASFLEKEKAVSPDIVVCPHGGVEVAKADCGQCDERKGCRVHSGSSKLNIGV